MILNTAALAYGIMLAKLTNNKTSGGDGPTARGDFLLLEIHDTCVDVLHCGLEVNQETVCNRMQDPVGERCQVVPAASPSKLSEVHDQAGERCANMWLASLA